MDIPKEVMWYGSAQPLPKQHQLQAGPCTLIYESGALRTICLGQHEVLRMIYLSLRDEQWGTVVPSIVNEQIHEEPQGFRISYEAHFKNDIIDFIADVFISGNQAGALVFEISGEALTDFMTNRTGICVLHPSQECQGKDFVVVHPDGTTSIHSYPSLISPHQPAKDISGMSWSIADQGKAHLQFEGEIFEMEDQRNWTDDSYKTYCRPLALPFPYRLKKGEKVHQRVTLKLSDLANHQQEGPQSYQFTYKDTVTFQLPKIGIGRLRGSDKLSGPAVEILTAAAFDFYTIDVVFGKNWEDEMNSSIEEAVLLNLKVKLQVQFSGNFEQEIIELQAILNGYEAHIDAILVLDTKSMVPQSKLVEDVAALLRSAFPGAKIGSGTLGNFAELNRARPDTANIDFISYSINPQVHAFDNSTLIENLSGQSATVSTARSFAKGKEIHISPVRLKPPEIPSSKSNVNKQKSSNSDPRQYSLFGGAWALGSVKKLAASGASCVSYFETSAENGIVQGDSPLPGDHHFPADSSAVYPMYYIFKEILQNKKGRILQSASSHPMKYEGMVLELDGKKTLILVNYTNEPLKVGINGFAPNSQVKKLDEKSYEEAVFDAGKYIISPFCDFKFEGEITMIKMRPYALVIINE